MKVTVTDHLTQVNSRQRAPSYRERKMRTNARHFGDASSFQIGVSRGQRIAYKGMPTLVWHQWHSGCCCAVHVVIELGKKSWLSGHSKPKAKDRRTEPIGPRNLLRIRTLQARL